MNIFKGIVCWFMTFILIISCNVYKPDYDNIVYDENGNKYYADFNYENVSLYVGVGNSINLLEEDVSGILDVFKKECNNPIFSSSISPIVPKDREEAVKYGISLLNSCFSEWTYDNNVIVSFNKNANLWVVSGLYLNRYRNNIIGIVVFSASSGELIVMGKM